jgi:predicted acetyltransferase
VAELTIPQETWASAVRDVAGETSPDEHPMYGRHLAALPHDRLGEWVQQILRASRPACPGLGDPVPTTHLWWVDRADYLGRITIRHRLNPTLRAGGHIGYWVSPRHRRRGHASAMLKAALPVAAQLELDTVIACCRPGNTGSRKAIEASGGLLQGLVGGYLRFLLPTP